MFPAISFPGYYSLPCHPNLAAWYRADALLGINTALPADGTSIATWFDLSGRNNHATQAVGANQPIFKTNIINGQPVVRFTFTNSTILTALNQTWLNPSSTFTMYVVWKTTTITPSGTSGIAGIVYKSSTSGGGPYGLQHTNANSQTVVTNTVSTTTIGSVGLAINTPYVTQSRYNAVNGFLKRNANSEIQTSVAAPIKTANQDVLMIGNALTTSSTRYFDGDIAEILVYDINLTSSAQLLAVRQYLGNKYGITIS